MDFVTLVVRCRVRTELHAIDINNRIFISRVVHETINVHMCRSEGTRPSWTIRSEKATTQFVVAVTLVAYVHKVERQSGTPTKSYLSVPVIFRWQHIAKLANTHSLQGWWTCEPLGVTAGVFTVVQKCIAAFAIFLSFRFSPRRTLCHRIGCLGVCPIAILVNSIRTYADRVTESICATPMPLCLRGCVVDMHSCE